MQTQVFSARMKNRIPLDEPLLVSQLNALVNSLDIPIRLLSTTDLTPRLLIAILESILGMRIPVVERQDVSQLSKIQNMKIFLGVLETDILKVDVGISQIDPRRLAAGERGEVLFIAELLCWIGRRMELIKPAGPADLSLPSSQARDIRPSPSTAVGAPTRKDSSPAFAETFPQLNMTATPAFQTGSTLTDPSTPPNDSRLKTPNEVEDDDELSSISDVFGGFPETLNQSQRKPPRCIHEISSPILGSSNKLPSTPPRSNPNLSRSWCPEHFNKPCRCNSFHSPERSPPVRYTGYIESVDEESEIASFELNRSMSGASERDFDMLEEVRRFYVLSQTNAELKF